MRPALHPVVTTLCVGVAVYAIVGYALLLGPLLFRAALRERRPGPHRWLGAIYLAVGVGVGGLSGLLLAINAYGGAGSRTGFAALALLWMATGALALKSILEGDVPAHHRWMTRNFALTLAAVTLRLYLPATMLTGLSLEVAYPLVAWLCWVPNLGAVEWRRHRAKPAAPGVWPGRYPQGRSAESGAD